MKIEAYIQHIPQIEGWLQEYRLDTIVCGMGPTAWLLPWLNQSMLRGIRLWGCHDACRIMPMDDLMIMDSPHLSLNPDTTRFQHVVDSRPDRLWLYDKNAPMWEPHIPKCMLSISKQVPFSVCRPNQVPANLDSVKFKLVADPLHTTSISSTGMTTLAWREGGRRIGIIGVDMQKGHHHTHAWWPVIDTFFYKIAQQADQAGGCVVNLSPITSLVRFKAWKPSTSGLAPTDGKPKQELSASSSTPSASTPPAMSTSTGCAPEMSDSKSAQTVPMDPGTSDEGPD